MVTENLTTWKNSQPLYCRVEPSPSYLYGCLHQDRLLVQQYLQLCNCPCQVPKGTVQEKMKNLSAKENCYTGIYIIKIKLHTHMETVQMKILFAYENYYTGIYSIRIKLCTRGNCPGRDQNFIRKKKKKKKKKKKRLYR